MSARAALYSTFAVATLAIGVGFNLTVVQGERDPREIESRPATRGGRPIAFERLKSLDELIERTSPANRIRGRMQPSSTPSLLPRPIERDDLAPPPLRHHTAAPATPALVRAVQRELSIHGYYPGSEDGTLGIVTRAALISYQHDQGLDITAEPTDGLLERLRRNVRPRPDRSHEPLTTSEAAVSVLLKIQSALKRLGHYRGPEDGRITIRLTHAIRSYQTSIGVEPTGRVSGLLIERLIQAPFAVGRTEAGAGSRRLDPRR